MRKLIFVTERKREFQLRKGMWSRRHKTDLGQFWHHTQHVFGKPVNVMVRTQLTTWVACVSQFVQPQNCKIINSKGK